METCIRCRKSTVAKNYDLDGVGPLCTDCLIRSLGLANLAITRRIAALEAELAQVKAERDKLVIAEAVCKYGANVRLNQKVLLWDGEWRVFKRIESDSGALEDIFWYPDFLTEHDAVAELMRVP